MKRWLPIIVALLVLAGAIAGSVILPTPQPHGSLMSLPVARMLACPVGDPNLGKTKVVVTDQTVFTAGVINALPQDPTTTAEFENPEKSIIVRGSATVAGISTNTMTDRPMSTVCAPPISFGTWSGVPVQDTAATLILTDVDASSAVVDVSLFGQTGPMPVAGLRDITVPAGSTQMLAIDQLVTADAPIAVQVRASKGRVSALLRLVGPGGYDWQLPQTAPDTDLVIAGIPGGAGTRTLSITNADTVNKATMYLQVIGSTSTFDPIGLSSIELLPARTVSIDITQALGGQDSAIHLQSDRPVSATVMAFGEGWTDITGVSAQPPLGGQVVLPAVGGTLWLANPTADPATVTIKGDQDGTNKSKDWEVPPGTVTSVPFPSTGGSAIVSTTSDVVRASLILQDSSWSILPITGGGVVAQVEVPAYDPGLG